MEGLIIILSMIITKGILQNFPFFSFTTNGQQMKGLLSCFHSHHFREKGGSHTCRDMVYNKNQCGNSDETNSHYLHSTFILSVCEFRELKCINHVNILSHLYDDSKPILSILA